MHCKFGVRIVIKIQIKYPWQIIDLIPAKNERLVYLSGDKKTFLANYMLPEVMKHTLEEGNALRFHDHV